MNNNTQGNYMKVFLGGTANSTWRKELIPLLDAANIEYFNPIVDDWNKEAQQNEIQERESCDFVIYVLTPKMHGCYSIAEVVDDSNKRPKRTILCILDRDGGEVFTPHQEKSMYQLVKMVENNGAYCVITLKAVINTLMLKHPMGALYALK